MKQIWYCKGRVTAKDEIRYSEVGEVGKAGLAPCAVHEHIRECLCCDEGGAATSDLSWELMEQNKSDFWTKWEVTPTESEYLEGWRDFYGEFEVETRFLFPDPYEVPESTKLIREACRGKYGGHTYCPLCGNCLVAKPGDICPVCQPLIGWHGRLYRAYQLYQTACENYGQCCGGIMTGNSGFYFHGKDWDGRYPEEGECHLWCEMGINFYEDEAGTYYLWDIDHSCGSEEYGDRFSYDDSEFWAKLMAQVNGAPEAMWNADWTSCPKCGYHVYAWADGICPCQEHEEEEDE